VVITVLKLVDYDSSVYIPSAFEKKRRSASWDPHLKLQRLEGMTHVIPAKIATLDRQRTSIVSANMYKSRSINALPDDTL